MAERGARPDPRAPGLRGEPGAVSAHANPQAAPAAVHLATWAARGRTPAAAELLVERGHAPPRRATWPVDIAFLSRHGVSAVVLDLAVRLARERGTAPRDELFALPRFSRIAYWRLMAADLGVGFVSDPGLLRPDPEVPWPGLEAVRAARQAFALSGRRRVLLVAPEAAHMPSLRRLLHHAPETAVRICVAPPETIRAVLIAGREGAHAHLAANRLARTSPASSARHVPRRRFLAQAAIAAAAVVGAALVAPRPVWIGIDLMLGLFFMHGIIWKLAAALHRPARNRRKRLSDAALPTYSVLVPLYREANMVADLIAALRRLDYPASKLQIILVLEADDEATRVAVQRHARDARFQLVTVPSAVPRTKPKALVYALPFARGDIVCVFDAEDRPERGQLREAAAALAADRRLACVQARLTPDNRESWLARMFSIEYAANFDVLLPALADWGVVLPLGGTSNHFRRDVLMRVGAWDPFNVTEDADLGVRLARFGCRVGVIGSRTYEEAPVRLAEWLPQRRRWLKGWLQTGLVALAPHRLGRSLGLADRFAVHGLISGGVLALLCYPALFAFLAAWLVAPDFFRLPAGPPGWFLLGLNLFNIVAFPLAAVISALRGLRRVRSLRLALWLPTLPLYWALMSLAGWQAVWQLVRDPFAWEKTAHGVSRSRQTGIAGAARRASAR